MIILDPMEYALLVTICTVPECDSTNVDQSDQCSVVIAGKEGHVSQKNTQKTTKNTEIVVYI